MWTAADVFVTTKIRPSRRRAGRARSSASRCRRSGTDYLDLWLVHWPPSRRGDSRQLWNELLEIQAEGLVRDVGVSNYSLTEIDDLIRSSGQAPAVNQIDWGPTLYDERLLAGHAERGIAVEGYSSLKNTNLDDPVLAKIAAAHGVTPAQVVLRWHLEHGVTVIPKSAQPGPDRRELRPARLHAWRPTRSPASTRWRAASGRARVRGRQRHRAAARSQTATE